VASLIEVPPLGTEISCRVKQVLTANRQWTHGRTARCHTQKHNASAACC